MITAARTMIEQGRTEMPKAKKRGAKDSEGGRSDPGWKYCIQLEMDESTKGKGYVYVQCNFCAKRITGGVARLKHHLTKIGKNVKACPKVPAEVSNEMKCLLAVHEEKNRRAVEEMEELCRVGAFGMEEPRGSNDPQTCTGGSSSVKQVRGPMDLFVGMAGSGSPTIGPTNVLEKQQQMTLNASWKKEERARVCRDIGRFFFEKGLAFNCVIHSVGAFGRGLKPPTARELRTWILKEEVNNIGNVMKAAKASWAETGCSIMSDGWTDTKGRSLINFLVNNPTGTWFLKSIDASDRTKSAQLLFSLLDDVVEEVGENNVIQVITDNASNYKAAGKLLMEKRQHLYWTPCATHCIDLMLEDILKLPLHASVFKKAKRVINYIYAHGWVLSMIRAKIGGDLVRPAVTRFATTFLTLQRLITVRDSLESFFASYAWKRSPYSSKPQGQSACNTILRRKSFWPGVAFVISTTKPLVMVLRMVDSEKYPPMGFIYEAMDRANEEIAHALGNEEEKYKPFWDIVDARWDRQLHTHLHAAAYFLNPQYHYEPSFSTHTEIKIGLYSCMERLISDPLEREKVDLQIDAFRNARGLFGYSNAVNTRKKRSPADWWRAFGNDTPELTKFAIKILSLTCSASGCERNWSSFNQVHTKRRNRLTQAKLNDLVYVMFNLKLKQREIKKKTMEDPLCLEDVDSGDEWVSELQTCEYSAYHELDANTPLEEDVEEADEHQDDSRRNKRKKETMLRSSEVPVCLKSDGFSYKAHDNINATEELAEQKDESNIYPSATAGERRNPSIMRESAPPNEGYNPVYWHDFYMWPTFYPDFQKVQQNQWNACENRFYPAAQEYVYPADHRTQYMPFKMISPGYPYDFQFQEFQYFVVMDFEATCDKEQPLHPQEIIEFPSVLVNSITGQLEASFQTYVRPAVHQHLTDFCKELTGIQQIQVDRGVSLSEALLMHDKWLEEKGIKHTNFVVVTWGDWDCRVMLESECKFKRIRKPPYFNRWINLKVPFKEVFGVRCNLKDAVQLAGLSWEGRPHCGLDDAWNTARILALIMRRGFRFSITNSLVRQSADGTVACPSYAGRAPPGSNMQTEKMKQLAGPINSVQFHPFFEPTVKERFTYCFCGVMSNMSMARQRGPNHGRYFFGCGNWTTTRGAMCSYFEWAS